MLPEIKSALERNTEAFENFVRKQNERLEDYLSRIEELESRASSPGRPQAKVHDEHTRLFTRWIRKPDNVEFKTALLNCQTDLERKDVLVGSGAAGGFAVPSEIAREIERHELRLSPVRRLVRVVDIGTPSYSHLLNLRGSTSGWVGESGTRSATATPLFRQIQPSHGELYAYPQASEWSLDDIFFNVGAWLAEEVAQEFALQEGEAVIRGNGSDKPTGMLNTAPVSTEDEASPLRAAAAYQFIADGPTGSPAVAQITADRLVDLVYKVNSQYRAGATWIMNSGTAGAIRKIKNAEGNFVWQQGLSAGQPDLLLGFPIETWEQMDDIGTNKFPVAFGDFRRAYLLVQRTGTRILQDPFSNPGFVRFYVRRREGGIVLNNDAAKWLKTVVA